MIMCRPPIRDLTSPGLTSDQSGGLLYAVRRLGDEYSGQHDCDPASLVTDENYRPEMDDLLSRLR